MILNFKPEHIISSGGFYYSPEFMVNAGDDLMTIECTLATNGSTLMQSSIDKVNWYDVENTVFNCSPSGMQSFAECQSELLYRVKSSTNISTINILI